jgi:hypothetical protein
VSRSSRNSRAPVWRPDELGVALYPDRLVLARVGGAWRRRLRDRRVLELAAPAPDVPSWQPALEALARLVAEGALARANVTLVLSSHFVHYTLVPWSELLSSESDQLAYVRQRFVGVHGAAAQGWALRLSRSAPRQPRLACGAPQSLIDALGEAMSPLGTRYRSLQPHLMASFNRWRTRLGARPVWFVAAEPGVACLALLRDGQWQSVRKLRIGADWARRLPDVLARERLMVDGEAECRQVWVFAPELPAVIAPGSGEWQIENLEPVPLPGMSVGGEGPYAIAMGA